MMTEISEDGLKPEPLQATPSSIRHQEVTRKMGANSFDNQDQREPRGHNPVPASNLTHNLCLNNGYRIPIGIIVSQYSLVTAAIS